METSSPCRDERQPQGVSVANLYDLKKCYEYVQHMKLIQNAAEEEFPSMELRISIHSYRWKRHATYNGLIHSGVLAVQSIVAGAAAATYELAALTPATPGEDVGQTGKNR